MVTSPWQHRQLLMTLTRREVVGRYRGSMLGLLWSFFNPIFLLAVFTFVFSVVFEARWGVGTGSKAEFALVLFAGLIIYNLFAECLNRAPALILTNASYVKKIVFPLEILPWVSFLTALFHTAISLLVWFCFALFVFGLPPLTALLTPLLFLPLMLLCLGFSWLLASLGVYLRDVSHLVGILTMALMFLTPIFYPISAVPETYRVILHLNPLTFIIDQVRGQLIFGTPLQVGPFCLLTAASLAIAWLGFAWFQKTRKGFADVL